MDIAYNSYDSEATLSEPDNPCSESSKNAALRNNKPSKVSSRFISKKIAKKTKRISLSSPNRSMKKKDINLFETKNTFCTDMSGLHETCDIIKKSTKYDDIETLQCILCCNEWAYNEPKYECIHCEQIYCGCVIGRYHQKMDTNDSNITFSESDDDDENTAYTQTIDNDENNGISNNKRINKNNGCSSPIKCSWSAIKLKTNDKKRFFHETALNIDENEAHIQPKKRRKLNNESIVFEEDKIDEKKPELHIISDKKENDILNDVEMNNLSSEQIIRADLNVKLNGCSSSIKCLSSTSSKNVNTDILSGDRNRKDLNDTLYGCSPSIILVSTTTDKKKSFHKITSNINDVNVDDIQMTEEPKLYDVPVVSGEDKMNKTKEEYIKYLENENKRLLAEIQWQRVVIAAQQREMIDGRVNRNDRTDENDINEEKIQNVVTDNGTKGNVEIDINDNDVCVFGANSWKRYYNDKDRKHYWFNAKTGKYES